jgi:hypothetical protein
MSMRLIPEDPTPSADTLELAARLEGPNTTPLRLWWRIPAEYQSSITLNADPFVVGLFFPMLQLGGTVTVEGVVSPSLLRNLEQFAAIWRVWRPGQYRPLQITAREEREASAPSHPDQVIASFSCGVDSAYTAFRHAKNLAGRRNRTIGAAMVMLGFDIQLQQKHTSTMYHGLLAGARATLGSLNIPCIPVSTNFRQLPQTWADSFATQLVSGLMLFSGRFGGALLPNNTPYDHILPWGSTPVSDPFLGTPQFPIIDDGGEFSRVDKVAAIAPWPEALQHIRVCQRNERDHTNCCQCEKCIRTILAFRIAGVPLPPAFPHDVTLSQIRRTKFHHDMGRALWFELLDGAKARGLEHAPWVKAIKSALAPKPLQALKRPFIPLRNAIRLLFRGATKSRRQLAAEDPPPAL